MYSDKTNVNMLTSLMVAHGVRHVVVCPGSRNAPLAHNFASCPDISCTAVTDERSAGFYAIGMSLACGLPVAVCVTSGSALLNLAPAVAEAYYRQIPLLVVSADRPQAMIGQLQGQTLPQNGMLGKFVKCSVALSEPHDDVEHWYCNRLINEALGRLRINGGGPVHINVPISEPLYGFTLPQLPCERKICFHESEAPSGILKQIASDFAKAERPMVVIGQIGCQEYHRAADAIRIIRDNAVVMSEKLSDGSTCRIPSLDTLLPLMKNEDGYRPDFIVYVGGNMVAKAMRCYLQQCKPQRSVVVSREDRVVDVLMNATDIVYASPADMLIAIAGTIDDTAQDTHDKAISLKWVEQWNALFGKAVAAVDKMPHRYSQAEAVRMLFAKIRGKRFDVHVANSTSVRLALPVADRYIYVNRGVDGIEGTLSTAAGYSLMSSCPVVCIIGDLSFFYDANALWHQGLCGNFRILLLNNGCGGIFSKFRPLADSPACDEYVMAHHEASAEGVCLQNRVAYRKAGDMEELKRGIDWLVNERSPIPMLLEVMLPSPEMKSHVC